MIALGYVSILHANLCCLIPTVCVAYQRTATATTAMEPAVFAAL
jgi:hypothetical protein